MTTYVNVEFVGGPIDGEVRCIHDHIHEYYVPLMNRCTNKYICDTPIKYEPPKLAIYKQCVDRPNVMMFSGYKS